VVEREHSIPVPLRENPLPGDSVVPGWQWIGWLRMNRRDEDDSG